MALFSELPNTCYRVSLKAVIRNKANHVLLVKEQSDVWSLPGGGLDHGESIHDALKRELWEEACVTAPFICKALGSEPMYIESMQSWLLWVVYEVTFDGDLTFDVGEHASEAAFIDVMTLQHSSARSERLAYKWGRMALAL